MMKKTTSKTGAALRELKAVNNRIERLAAKIPKPIVQSVLEQASKTPVTESLMSVDTRRRLIRRLIQSEFHDNEFIVDLDMIATEPTKAHTLPLEITLPKDTWVMVARIAHHKKWTYGQVIAGAAADTGLSTICQWDDEARGVSEPAND